MCWRNLSESGFMELMRFITLFFFVPLYKLNSPINPSSIIMTGIEINSSAIAERFMRYVQIDTQSDPKSDTHPSTEKQKI